MSAGSIYITDPSWNTNGASTTWNGGVTFTGSNSNAYWVNPDSFRATIMLDDVQVATPAPRTEVERLLAEVDSVCALAR